MEFRKHYSGYLKNLPGIAKVRHELMQFTEHRPLVDYITRLRERLLNPDPASLTPIAP